MEEPDPINTEQPERAFKGLIDIVAYLRSDDGCPWDQEQTLESMIGDVQEEATEVVEAIKSGNPESIEDELGDLILQGVFLSQIASERGLFDITDVLTSVTEKLRRRHPHVFGDENLETSEEVLERWEEIKQQERQGD